MLETVAAPALPLPIHRWTREEYLKMVEIGLFEGQRVEFIEGQVIEMSPVGNPHSTAVLLADKLLERVFGPGYHTRAQVPFDAGGQFVPQPDVAVVVGNVRDYPLPPTAAVLIIEVSDSSLLYDRTKKAVLYARAGVPEYWVVNLVDRHLEVRRGPGEEGYQDTIILPAGEFVTPLARPAARIAVADLLP